MIYLNKKQFLPAMILINVIFVPLILPLSFVSIYDLHIPSLIILGIMLIVYLLLVFYFFKVSRSTKNYLVIQGEGLEICCENKYCDQSTGIWKVSYRKIIRLEYYKISSLMGWFSLWTGLCPRCVFLTIRNNSGIEESVFIGYLDLDQVRMLSQKGNIELLIH